MKHRVEAKRERERRYQTKVALNPAGKRNGATRLSRYRFKPREALGNFSLTLRASAWASARQDRSLRNAARLSLSPRVVPASVRRTADELPAGSLVSNTLSSGLAQKNFPLQDSG